MVILGSPKRMVLDLPPEQARTTNFLAPPGVLRGLLQGRLRGFIAQYAGQEFNLLLVDIKKFSQVFQVLGEIVHIGLVNLPAAIAQYVPTKPVNLANSLVQP